MATTSSIAPCFVLPGDEVPHAAGEAPDALASVAEEDGGRLVARFTGLLPPPPDRADGAAPPAARAAGGVRRRKRRYAPAPEDSVLGVVEERSAEQYRVNVLGPSPAVLPALAFPGATKRNRPNLQVGALVYCRVAGARADTEPELSCVATRGLKRDWMTGQATYGPLRGGATVRCSLGLCGALLRPANACLAALGRRLAYEVAIGANGLVWVHSPSARASAVICSAILNSEALSDEQTDAMVERLVAALPSE